MATLLSALFVFLLLKISQYGVSSQIEEPNLHELLAGVKNCEVQLIQKTNGVSWFSNIHHFRDLPTTIINVQTNPEFKRHFEQLAILVKKVKIDIFKGRAPFFRISYTHIKYTITLNILNYVWLKHL